MSAVPASCGNKNKISIARKLAYDAFIQIMEKKQNSDHVINDIFNDKKYITIKRIDKNFIKELLFGSLRWYSKLYWILQKTSKRDLKTVSPECRSALILGTYQIFYMDRVPDRSAVNESVKYIKFKKEYSATTYINGILRTIARKTEYYTKPDKEKKPISYLSLQYSHPIWLVNNWLKKFSFDRTRAILAYNNQNPPYTIRINALKFKTRNEIQYFHLELLRKEKLISYNTHLNECLKLKQFPAKDKNSLFLQGYFSFQDESSQLIAHLVSPQKGERILDACMGPGGKTSHIYELSRGTIHLTAIDNSKNQVERAASNFHRLGINSSINFSCQDFLEYKDHNNYFDKILIDAPCSGLGVIRRKPESKWLKDTSILNKFTQKQRKLLQKAYNLVKDGGEVVYSVCSFEDDEVKNQLLWLKETYREKIEIVPLAERIPDYYLRFVVNKELLLIIPNTNLSMDGFGAFVFRKKN